MQYIYYVEDCPDRAMSGTFRCRTLEKALEWAKNLQENYYVKNPGIFRVFLKEGGIAIERYVDGKWFAPVYNKEKDIWEYCLEVAA